jgi:O-methyltransferase
MLLRTRLGNLLRGKPPSAADVQREFVNLGLLSYQPNQHAIRSVALSDDPVRHAHTGIAITRILRERIPGSFAEVGVYRGNTSRIIHSFAPDRKLYLFDTFEGFPERDLASENLGDLKNNFRDTNIEVVRHALNNSPNVDIRPGYFPETAHGLENDTFAFVMLDVDLYKPTLDGLRFFYPRVSPGAFVFIHDYSTNKGNAFEGVSRAVDEFMRDVPEQIVEIPDRWGTGLFRKAAAL